MKDKRFGKAHLGLIVSLLPWLLAAPLFAQDQPAPDQVAQGDAPGRAARLSYINGSVSMQPSGATAWSQATLNYTLTTGDRLYTDPSARAELEVGSFAVRLAGGTDLTMANLTNQIMQLGIGQGTVRVTVFDMPSGNTVEIDTPNGALTAGGPGSYRVEVDPTNGTRVIVNNGSLQVSGGDVNQTVGQGQAVQLTGTGPIQVSSVDFPGADDFDNWSASRDQRVQQFASRQYVNPEYVPGAEDLEGHGRWQEVGDYGPVWYPNDVASGWVPYSAGYWGWVEPWGWTWVAAEPWGFAPFHYGRWAVISGAWGWVPGPVVVNPFYAPALVAFVGGGGFSVGFSVGGLGLSAWFPLGPSEPFIPWYHYNSGYLRQVNVTNVRNVTNITNIINNTTNITNIHYVNKAAGTTAVPATVFRSGQGVAAHVVHVPAAQLAKAQVIAHPAVAPTRSAMFAGKAPVKAPPVRAAKLVAPPAATPGARPATRAAGQPPARGTPPPAARPAERAATPLPARTETAQPGRPAASALPPAASKAPPPTARRSYAAPPATPPHFITKAAPPPRDLPFEAHQQALAQHPGRPLEPQQENNLRAGKAAGPPVDREVLPHGPPPRPAVRSEARPAPRQEAAPRPQERPQKQKP